MCNCFCLSFPSAVLVPLHTRCAASTTSVVVARTSPQSQLLSYLLPLSAYSRSALCLTVPPHLSPRAASLSFSCSAPMVANSSMLSKVSRSAESCWATASASAGRLRIPLSSQPRTCRLQQRWQCRLGQFHVEQPWGAIWQGPTRQPEKPNT